MFRRIRFLALRSATLAGLSIITLACASVTPVYGRCRDREDQRASQTNPYYPALREAVDNYFAKAHQAAGFSGVVCQCLGQWPRARCLQRQHVASGWKPICPDTLFEIGSITKSFTAVMLLKLEVADVLHGLPESGIKERSCGDRCNAPRPSRDTRGVTFVSTLILDE